MSRARVAAALLLVSLIPCCAAWRNEASGYHQEHWLLQLSYSAALSDHFIGLWIAQDGSVYDLGARRDAIDEGRLRHAGNLATADLAPILARLPSKPGIYGGTYDGPALRLHYKTCDGSWVFVVMDGILPDPVQDLADLVYRHSDAALQERLGRLRRDLLATDADMPRRVESLAGVAPTPFAEGDGLPVYFHFKGRQISGEGSR
jgi:hypothetical protein